MQTTEDRSSRWTYRQKCCCFNLCCVYYTLRFSLSFTLPAQSWLQAFLKTSKFSGIIVSPRHDTPRQRWNRRPHLFFVSRDFRRSSASCWISQGVEGEIQGSLIVCECEGPLITIYSLIARFAFFTCSGSRAWRSCVGTCPSGRDKRPSTSWGQSCPGPEWSLRVWSRARPPPAGRSRTGPARTSGAAEMKKMFFLHSIQL